MHYKDFTIYCCGSCLLKSSRLPNVAVAICTPLDWPEWLCQTYPLPCWAWSHLVWCLQHLHTLRVAGRNEPAGRSWARNLWLVSAAFKCESKRTMCVYLCLEMCVFTQCLCVGSSPVTHLYACDKLLDAIFGRHIHHSHHMTLPSDVSLQAP